MPSQGRHATQAFPPGHPELPADVREFEHLVLIPGTMGTASYVLTGGPACGGISRSRRP
ncbi:RtcB family protein [Streptomyces sp. NPDC048415]|uniref:RtcB family protein n=1 Tax=Streptomyces sp. NPDC048415 TaxID=3154822 RepID=UPI003419AC5D